MEKSMQLKQLKRLYEWIGKSDNIVFFGGAGVSTESGIPDFRSATGIYSKAPEYMLSHTYYAEHTADFFKFYRENMIFTGVKPNAAHYTLAKLERAGKLKAVITQNIDGLHQAAGSENVLELHGSIHRNYCVSCGKAYKLDHITDSESVIPKCACGGIVKPDVVLYEEQLDDNLMAKARKYIADADMLIVGGTSLTVQPAGSLIFGYKGDKLVLINMTQTPYDNMASLAINGKIGEVLGG
jgi:NAD-dependent deacetylase